MDDYLQIDAFPQRLPVSANDYLRSLSSSSDDGRSLLKAPQRYSSRQWQANLLSIVDCRILRAVRAQLLWQVVWATLVSLLYMTRRGIPTLPALPHSLLGGVMGVLLGFRTNQSCARHAPSPAPPTPDETRERTP